MLQIGLQHRETSAGAYRSSIIAMAGWSLVPHQAKLVFRRLSALMLARPVTLHLISELDEQINSSMGKSLTSALF